MNGRTARYIIGNVVYLGLLYCFLMLSVEGARNIITVWTYLIAVASLFYISDEAIKIIKEKGRPAPAWCCATIDIIAIVSLLWFGHTCLGVAMIMHAALENAAYSKALGEKP